MVSYYTFIIHLSNMHLKHELILFYVAWMSVHWNTALILFCHCMCDNDLICQFQIFSSFSFLKMLNFFKRFLKYTSNSIFKKVFEVNKLWPIKLVLVYCKWNKCVFLILLYWQCVTLECVAPIVLKYVDIAIRPIAAI